MIDKIDVIIRKLMKFIMIVVSAISNRNFLVRNILE